MGLVSDTRQELLIPALTYVGSVVVGPAIFLGGYESITGGVMDYCDPVHGAPASREARFTAVQSFRHRHYAGCRACPADYLWPIATGSACCDFAVNRQSGQ
ncbi:hypothetical protein [Nocardia abscessus]|uniref:hypothetical protein n=1 Tax=Nocardia abscessus TaxID=120957 RepID=UPI0024577886|nr:hypothetical protein [Nocardia abscessus]